MTDSAVWTDIGSNNANHFQTFRNYYTWRDRDKNPTRKNNQYFFIPLILQTVLMCVILYFSVKYPSFGLLGMS